MKRLAKITLDEMTDYTIMCDKEQMLTLGGSSNNGGNGGYTYCVSRYYAPDAGNGYQGYIVYIQWNAVSTQWGMSDGVQFKKVYDNGSIQYQTPPDGSMHIFNNSAYTPCAVQ